MEYSKTKEIVRLFREELSTKTDAVLLVSVESPVRLLTDYNTWVVKNGKWVLGDQ